MLRTGRRRGPERRVAGVEAARARSPRPAAKRAGRSGRLLLGALAVLVFPSASPAQDVHLSGFAGWRFGGSGRSPIDYQELDVAGAHSYGGCASLRLWRRNAVELYFSRAEGAGRRRFESDELRVAVSYLLVGLVHELKTDGVRPFLGVAMGGARLREDPLGARTLFATAGLVGVRVFPAPHVGLRADGRVLFVSDDRSSSRTRDPLGGSSGFSVTSDSLIQAELTVGLVLAF